MILRRQSETSLTGLISLVLLYVILIALVLVFSNQVLSDLSFSRDASGLIILILAVVFPALLMVVIVVNLIRLVGDRARGRPGARFKTRLFGFFLVVVLLASIPQGILSVNFIDTAMNTWFSTQSGEAIRGAQSIALDFYGDEVTRLQSFVGSRFFGGLLEGVDRKPDAAWDVVRSVNPAIDGMQVFDPQFNETFFAGPEAVKLSPIEAAAARDLQVTKESIAGASFLRVRTSVFPSADARLPSIAGIQVDERYTVIFTVLLPDGFDATAAELTDAISFFSQLERFQDRFVVVIAFFYAFFSLPMVLISILVAFFLSDEVIRPIVNLEDATRRVAEGDFTIRILSRRGDELSLLVESFNRMVSELDRARTKIIQTEKIAAWQEIAQRLAHEIKNPLTPIRLAAERSLRKYKQDAPDFESVFESSVHAIISEVENLNALLSEFREFSRLPDASFQDVDLRELVEEASQMYAGQTSSGIDIAAVPEAIELRADPAQLKQVFANLYRNAIEAAGPDVSISVRADRVRKGAEHYCRIQVTDDGPGIPVDDQEHIFDPYYTTKRHGTGLGLAIVERIVFDHRGRVWFETDPAVGTSFLIEIPFNPEEIV